VLDREPVPAAPLGPAAAPARQVFPWIVFALSFALLLSDYMCRQVLAAVFPQLRAEWALSDAQLGALSSVVALTVGVLTVPLSVLADRFGRRRALVAGAGCRPRRALRFC
jgi:MFS family permease